MSLTDAEKKLISRTALPHTMKMDIVAETDLSTITFPNRMGQGVLQIPVSGDVLTTRDIPCIYPQAWRKDQTANCVFRSLVTREISSGQVIQYSIPISGNTFFYQKIFSNYVRSNMQATFRGKLIVSIPSSWMIFEFDIEAFSCEYSDFGNSEYLIQKNSGWMSQNGSNGVYPSNIIYAYKSFPLRPSVSTYASGEVAQVIDYDGELVMETTRNYQWIGGQPDYTPIAGGIPQYFVLNGWIDVETTQSNGETNTTRYASEYVPGRANRYRVFNSSLFNNALNEGNIYTQLERSSDGQRIIGRNVSIGENSESSATMDIDISYDLAIEPSGEYIEQGYLEQGNDVNILMSHPSRILSHDTPTAQMTGRYNIGSSTQATFNATVTLSDLEFLHTI